MRESNERGSRKVRNSWEVRRGIVEEEELGRERKN